jgi:hypothetical protein
MTGSAASLCMFHPQITGKRLVKYALSVYIPDVCNIDSH